MSKKISEKNLIDFLCVILSVEKEISLQDFIDRVSKAFELSEYDLSISKTRPGEPMYVQRCRNLNCHRNFPRNMVSYENCIFKAK